MEQLEEIRKKLRTRYIIFAIIIIATLCVGYGYLAMEVIFLVMLEVIIMVFATHKLNAKYRGLFKSMFVEKSLNELFDNLIYQPEKGLPYDVIASTKMMNMGDRYHSEDYVSGEYKGIKFEQADVHIEEEHETTDSDGHTQTSYVTIFKGRWLVFDFNKNFKANAQISEKGFGNSKVKRFFGKKEDRFKRVKMESEEFNKKFKVYAQDEHEAFYLITPSLMERIERLVNSNKGKFLFCFVDQRLHIGLYNHRSSFEPTSVFKKLDLQKIEEDVSKDIKVITQFVDELNLDNNLFKVGV